MAVVDVEVMPPLPEPGSFGVLVEVRGERIGRGLRDWNSGRWCLERAREPVAVPGGRRVPREPPQRPQDSKRTIGYRHYPLTVWRECRTVILPKDRDPRFVTIPSTRGSGCDPSWRSYMPDVVCGINHSSHELSRRRHDVSP